VADALALDLVDKHLVTDQLVLTVGYDVESLRNPSIHYDGPLAFDHYGRQVPKHAHGTSNLPRRTSSSRMIIEATEDLYRKVVNPRLLVRRIYLTACRVVDEEEAKNLPKGPVQLDLFTDYEALAKKRKAEEEVLAKERKLQETTLAIKKQFGKNALLRGLNFSEGATARQRNEQIGGHKA
jgi:DNA polymerase V